MRVLGIAITTTVGLALAAAVAGAFYSLAAVHYAPAPPVLGASSTSVNGWNIVLPGQPKPLVAPTDLAAQARVDGPALVATAAVNSSYLIVLAAALALGIGVPLGLWLAVLAPRPLAAAIRAATSVGITFPAFFLAFSLQLVAIALAERNGRTILPVYGFGIDGHLVIPTISLALAPIAYVTRLVALAAEDIATRDFVRTARAKGLLESAIVSRHLVPNLVGALGEAGLGAVRLALGGLVIVEFLLVWPGVGLLILRAANVQDTWTFIAGVSVLATAFLAVEIGLDLVTRRSGRVSG